MRFFDRCLGLPSIALDTAEDMGATTHYVTDPVANRVIGFIVSKANRLAVKCAYLFGDVVNFGEDAILLSAQDAVRPVEEVGEIVSFLSVDKERRRRKAISTDGQLLGTVTEYTFDEETGQVLSYWLEPKLGEGTEIFSEALASSGKGLVLLHREALSHFGHTADQEVMPRGAEEEIYPEVTREPVHSLVVGHPTEAEPIGQVEESAAEVVDAEILHELGIDHLETEEDAQPVAIQDQEVAKDRLETSEVHANGNGSGLSTLNGFDTSANGHTNGNGSGEAHPVEVVHEEVAVSASEAPIANANGNEHSDEPVHANGNGVMVSEDASAESSDQIRKFMPLLVGAHVNRDIRSEGGETIIAQGQEVTPTVVENAWRVNRLFDLYLAAQTHP